MRAPGLWSYIDLWARLTAGCAACAAWVSMGGMPKAQEQQHRERTRHIPHQLLGHSSGAEVAQQRGVGQPLHLLLQTIAARGLRAFEGAGQRGSGQVLVSKGQQAVMASCRACPRHLIPNVYA